MEKNELQLDLRATFREADYVPVYKGLPEQQGGLIDP